MALGTKSGDIDSDLVKKMVSVRQDIHRHPELAFEENRTSEIVARWLEAHGYKVTTGIGHTGVVGTLTRGTSKRAFGFRADMDALPMNEENLFSHRSVHEGKFHGCGHDGHTAMLLGAAAQIAEHGRFDGVVHLIFQPAEESGGGAKKMVEDGLFERFNVESVYALHNMPGLAVGTFATRSGAFLSELSTFNIEFKGVGGHGAMPQLAVDPVPAVAAFVQAAQTIVSRNVDPLESSVVSITGLQSGSTFNVIPDSAVAFGAMRCFSDEVGDLLLRRLVGCAEGVAAAHGCTVQNQIAKLFPSVVNSDAETQTMLAAATNIVGAKHVDGEASPVMASEDFAYMLRERPGCYMLIGNGEGESSCSVHNPEYDFNDDIIPHGIAFWSELIEVLAPTKK